MDLLKGASARMHLRWLQTAARNIDANITVSGRVAGRETKRAKGPLRKRSSTASTEYWWPACRSEKFCIACNLATRSPVLRRPFALLFPHSPPTDDAGAHLLSHLAGGEWDALRSSNSSSSGAVPLPCMFACLPACLPACRSCRCPAALRHSISPSKTKLLPCVCSLQVLLTGKNGQEMPVRLVVEPCLVGRVRVLTATGGHCSEAGGDPAAQVVSALVPQHCVCASVGGGVALRVVTQFLPRPLTPQSPSSPSPLPTPGVEATSRSAGAGAAEPGY